MNIKIFKSIFFSLVEISSERERDEHKSHHSFFDDYCLYVVNTKFAVFFLVCFIQNLQNNHLKNEWEESKKQLIHTDSVYKFVCVLLTKFKVKQFWCLNFKYFSRFCVFASVRVIQLHKNEKREKNNDCLNIIQLYILLICAGMLFCFFFFCCFMLCSYTKHECDHMDMP